MKAIKGLLIDLDGVLYVGDKAIAGALETLEECDRLGLPVRFVTNTTTRTAGEVVEKLQGLGFTVSPGEIFSAVSATVDALRREKDGNPTVELVVRESILPEFETFPRDDEKPDFVVVGDIGAAWSYPLMNRVFRQLMTGAELLSMHKNKFFQTHDGLSLDIGAFVEGLEFVTGKTARIIGKPSREFFEAGLRSLGLAAHEVAMVGDDIDSDVGGAQSAGLQGILVQTGKYRQEIANQSEIQPELVLSSIAELPSRIAD